MPPVGPAEPSPLLILPALPCCLSVSHWLFYSGYPLAAHTHPLPWLGLLGDTLAALASGIYFYFALYMPTPPFCYLLFLTFYALHIYTTTHTPHSFPTHTTSSPGTRTSHHLLPLCSFLLSAHEHSLLAFIQAKWLCLQNLC